MPFFVLFSTETPFSFDSRADVLRDSFTTFLSPLKDIFVLFSTETHFSFDSRADVLRDTFTTFLSPLKVVCVEG